MAVSVFFQIPARRHISMLMRHFCDVIITRKMGGWITKKFISVIQSYLYMYWCNKIFHNAPESFVKNTIFLTNQMERLSHNHAERQAAHQASASAAVSPMQVYGDTSHDALNRPQIHLQGSGGASQCYIVMNESNLMLPLDTTPDARCGYGLSSEKRTPGKEK